MDSVNLTVNIESYESGTWYFPAGFCTFDFTMGAGNGCWQWVLAMGAGQQHFILSQEERVVRVALVEEISSSPLKPANTMLKLVLFSLLS